MARWLIMFFSMGLWMMNAGCEAGGDCSGTVSLTQSIGQDVTADFNVDSVATNGEILTSDCSVVTAGSTISDTLQNVTRVGNALTVTVDSETTIPAVVSNNNVEEFSQSQEVAGCNITMTVTGELDTANNEIDLTGSFVATGITCNAAL